MRVRTTNRTRKKLSWETQVTGKTFDAGQFLRGVEPLNSLTNGCKLRHVFISLQRELCWRRDGVCFDAVAWETGPVWEKLYQCRPGAPRGSRPRATPATRPPAMRARRSVPTP